MVRFRKNVGYLAFVGSNLAKEKISCFWGGVLIKNSFTIYHVLTACGEIRLVYSE